MKKLLSRGEAANYLRSLGLQSSKDTLAKHAMTGEGPCYVVIGRCSYYKPQWLDERLESQITPHNRSSTHMIHKS